MFRKFPISALVLVFYCLFNFTPISLADDNQHFFGPSSRYPVKCDPKKVQTLLNVWSDFKKSKSLAESGHRELSEVFSAVPSWCLSEDIEQSILAAFKNLGILPCNPSEIKRPIEVVLSGEMHGTRRSGDVVSMYLDEVGAKKTTMAIEKNLEQKLPLPANACHYTLRADGEMAHSFCVLRSLLDEADSSSMVPTDKIEEYFLASQGLRDALAKTQAPNNRSVRELVEKITEVIQWQRSQAKAPRPRHPGNVSSGVLRSFIEVIAKTHFGQLSDPNISFSEVPPTLPDEISNRTLRSKSFDKEVVLGYRNRNLGFSGLRMICQAAEGEQKKVVIHMGAGHMAGVYKYLVDALSRSGVGDKVTVKADTSVLDDPGILASEISPSEQFKKTYAEVLQGISSIPASNLISVPLPSKSEPSKRRRFFPEFEFAETRSPKLGDTRATEIKGDIYETLRNLSPEDYWSVDSRDKIRAVLNLVREYAGLDPKSTKSLQLTIKHDNKNFYPNQVVSGHLRYLEICVIQPNECVSVGRVGLMGDPDNLVREIDPKVGIQFHPSFLND
jgi:hypothetical protein